MLQDIGPGLWSSVNPGYAPLKLASSQHSVHRYQKSKGWGEHVSPRLDHTPTPKPTFKPVASCARAHTRGLAAPRMRD